MNHFHLFENVGEAGRTTALELGKAIAQNLLSALTNAFPKKHFIVYLELNVRDSTIVRFHQVWEDEPPYIDVTQAFDDGSEIYDFST
jgi:hypothetical protein